MSQEQIKRLRSQDLFKMEKTEQDTSKQDEPQKVDELSPEVKMVIEEKLKTLKVKKQPIIMPVIKEEFTYNANAQMIFEEQLKALEIKKEPLIVPAIKKRTGNANKQEPSQKKGIKSTNSTKYTFPGTMIPRLERSESYMESRKAKSPTRMPTARKEVTCVPNETKAIKLQLKDASASTHLKGSLIPIQLKGSSTAAQYQAGAPVSAQLQGAPTAAQFQGAPTAAQFQAPQAKYLAGVPRTFLFQTGAASAIQPQTFQPSTSQGQALDASGSQMYPPHIDASTSQMYPPHMDASASQMYTPHIDESASQLYSPNMDASPSQMSSPNNETFQNNPLTKMYTSFETGHNDDAEEAEGSESPDALEPGQKRLSAFKRLGPLSQSKKPKLTINLMVNKEDAVREVVDDNTKAAPPTHIPVYLRKDVLESTDETVVMYLDKWPWKKNIGIKKTITSKTPKSAQHQIMEFYDREQDFIQVVVKGYPPTWTKEDVLDTILDALMGRSFIPCFIEFNEELCKFLVIRCKAALLAIYKSNFSIRKGDVVLSISISSTHLNIRTLNFVPRFRLTKKLLNGCDGAKSISLKAFTLQSDISHFIYFPLRFDTNQSDLIQLQTSVAWDRLTDLDLSYNNLTSIDGFDLKTSTPKLKHLDLSHNHLGNIHSLLKCRDLGLRSIKLEGNPMCHNYIDPGHYIKVLKTMFPSLVEIDGTPITPRGQIPIFYTNYCPHGAESVVDKFLTVYFPLLESYPEDRAAIEDLYEEDAVLTITFRYKLRYSPGYRYSRNLFLRSRILEEEEMESITGGSAIAKLLSKWPMLVHDPSSFTIDVLHHNEWSTIIRIGGILKLTSETLAEDEHLMTFGRTVVLRTKNEVEYKIQNELLYWDEPTEEYARSAFRFTMTKPRSLKLKLESAPDDYLKEKLVEIFVKLTDLDKKNSERCLQQKDWNIKSALEYFVKLLKLDGLQALKED